MISASLLQPILIGIREFILQVIVKFFDLIAERKKLFKRKVK